MKKLYDVIVIGGGPAGMMAAGCAGAQGATVCLVEKNDRLGKKLSITGGRRCNITNAETDNHLFLENFASAKNFLFSPFSQFNVDDTFTFFESRGLPLVVEDRKRTFPKSQKAEDVCKTLEIFVDESGMVDIRLGTEVQSFIADSGGVHGVKTSKGDILGKKIIFATGGFAAPETGSTGEGLAMLSAIGHTVTEPDPNLAPLKTSARWVHGLSGTSVDDMCLRYLQEGKIVYKERGRILFTHFGISGPLVINSAFQAKELLKKGPLTASIDLFPDYDLGSLDAYLLTVFHDRKNKKLKTVMRELLQKKLAETILKLPNIEFGEVFIHSLSKEQRKVLVRTLKDLVFPITGTMGFGWSIVADGGVVPEEIHFKTMQSRLHANLYLIGDTIHVNRPSGGFSLQLCWTTGWIAGHHAVKTL